MKIPFVTTSRIYTPEEIILVLNKSVTDDMLVTKRENKGSVKLYNAPAAFDIETSSFYQADGSKAAIMYEWSFGINGNVIIGRTWDEFTHMLEVIAEHLHLTATEKRLIVYVHNLSFDFQFFRKHLKLQKVFSLDTRKPVTAITESGIEFRCSYILSNFSLQHIGQKELHRYPVQKMTGDLDYTLVRHSETPLSDKELKYCEHDVRVVMAYIQEKIETDGGIHRIPLTKTGYVRRYCRTACLYSSADHKKETAKFTKYRKLMDSMTLDVPEYKQLKRAFQGGFTHANSIHSGIELSDVASYDFTSAYPYTMVANKFPMSRGILVNGDGHLNSYSEFISYLNNFCCLFDIEFVGLLSKVRCENYLSESHCRVVKPVADNGRIFAAERLQTTMTDVDFSIVSRMYTWEKLKVGNFRIYARGYLPTDFVNAILKLYQDKTVLKGVKGSEIEYFAAKSMLNAAYGMCVTDPCRIQNIYDVETHDWRDEQPDLEQSIERYNNSKNRFLFYPWGVWVTAYARQNLYTGILEFQEDYVYSDTDSIKCFNREAHEDYIQKYNTRCREQLQLACKHHNIPFEMVEPSTIKGVKKLLGVWDYEGTYSRFKTLGAKRYMTEQDGEISITVSGMNKTAAVPYLLDKYGQDAIFDAFDDNLYIPADFSGRNTHTYIDDEIYGTVIDYLGKSKDFHELSCVHIEKADYNLSLSMEYIKFLMGVRTVEY